MNGKLLDTNIVIALFARDRTVEQQLARSKVILLPCIVVGELYFGAYKSTRIAENIARIQEFTAKNRILVCDQDTAHKYGQIKSALKAKETPLPENDMWVAAIALQYELTLVTRDEHFRAIERIRLEHW